MYGSKKKIKNFDGLPFDKEKNIRYYNDKSKRISTGSLNRLEYNSLHNNKKIWIKGIVFYFFKYNAYETDTH